MNTTHTLSGDAETREVYLDGKFLDPRPSQAHRNHSPDGFNWGYGGSGPAQLALAIMLKVTGKSDGYQDFKFAVISNIPMGADFEIKFQMDSETGKFSGLETNEEPGSYHDGYANNR